MFVKPNPEKKVGKEPLKVFDPVHRDFLPENGREVANNAYWMRRLSTKDVVETINIPAETKSKGKDSNGAATTKKNKAQVNDKSSKEKSTRAAKKAPAETKSEGKDEINENKEE